MSHSPRQQKQIVHQLQEQLNRLEVTRRQQARRKKSNQSASDLHAEVSSGCTALDRLLPSGGFVRGSLVEWLGLRGGGAGTLALLAARQAAKEGGSVVIVDRRRWFYPPAAAAWGLDPQRLILVWPSSLREELWAVDQSLRCTAVAAVWARPERLEERWFRRWQLAAEEAGTLGLLLRAARVRKEPSWADVQLLVAPVAGLSEPGSSKRQRPRFGEPGYGQRGRVGDPTYDDEDLWRLRIEVTRCRGAAAGGAVELEVDGTRGEVREVPPREKTLFVPLATSLAHPAVGHREARA
jgi:hypothetical protein